MILEEINKALKPSRWIHADNINIDKVFFDFLHSEPITWSNDLRDYELNEIHDFEELSTFIPLDIIFSLASEPLSNIHNRDIVKEILRKGIKFVFNTLCHLRLTFNSHNFIERIKPILNKYSFYFNTILFKKVNTFGLGC